MYLWVVPAWRPGTVGRVLLPTAYCPLGQPTTAAPFSAGCTELTNQLSVRESYACVCSVCAVQMTPVSPGLEYQ